MVGPTQDCRGGTDEHHIECRLPVDSRTYAPDRGSYAAGFTNSASPSSDKLSTLIQLAVFAAQMGMFRVGLADGPGGNLSISTPANINRIGSWLGVMGQSNGDQSLDLTPSHGDIQTATRLGERLALVTRRWHGCGSYVTERGAFT
jgi:NAD(P)H dehydrogenase (quinone)